MKKLGAKSPISDPIQHRSRIMNFPVGLLRGFMDDRKRKSIMEDIIVFATHEKAIQIELNREKGKGCGVDNSYFREAMDILNWHYTTDDDDQLIAEAIERARHLKHKWEGCARTGISSKIYWDYRKNIKDDYKVAQLLGFLALKSIVGQSKLAKTNNKHWIARMSGLNKEADGQLDSLVENFMTVYRIKKLKKLLQLHWHMKHYGQYTRGFWVSFDENVSLVDLALHAEKSKMTNKLRAFESDEQSARLLALKELGIKH